MLVMQVVREFQQLSLIQMKAKLQSLVEGREIPIEEARNWTVKDFVCVHFEARLCTRTRPTMPQLDREGITLPALPHPCSAGPQCCWMLLTLMNRPSRQTSALRLAAPVQRYLDRLGDLLPEACRNAESAAAQQVHQLVTMHVSFALLSPRFRNYVLIYCQIMYQLA